MAECLIHVTMLTSMDYCLATWDTVFMWVLGCPIVSNSEFILNYYNTILNWEDLRLVSWGECMKKQRLATDLYIMYVCICISPSLVLKSGLK